MVKSMADAVDELLDREQADQPARERYGRIKRGDRRSRGETKAAKAPQVIDVAKPYQAERYPQHHDADENLDDQTWRPVHRFGNRGQIQVIIAAGGNRSTNEDRVDEEGRGDLLQPQPGVTERARDNVEHYREREAEAQDSAQYHQRDCEPVERPPFQMTLPLQHQFVGDGH